MSRKVVVFIGDILLALIVGVLAFGLGGLFSTSLQVTCELENDETYACLARDTLLNWTVSEKQAEHVASLKQHVECSGSGGKRGCSQISEFITTTGEQVQLSKLFTASESQVTQLVTTVNDLMEKKSTPINYTSESSPWLIFDICLSSFLLVMLLLRAFLRASLKDKDSQSADLPQG